MAIAQIKNLQRRLANLESEATSLDRTCGNNLWLRLALMPVDGLGPRRAGSGELLLRPTDDRA